MDSIKLGIKIRKCRQARHLSQNELAEKAEISTRYLGDIERGAKIPKLSTFINLLNAMNVSADYVLMDALHVQQSELEVSFEYLPPETKTKMLDVLETMIRNFANG
ncbi:MAG: helix-turn-helix transcriptional regulator [Clostridiales bacterium]|jgi:transcriptional regulator with XRE-family HTH domain|nr:helix-turn-helix transcriptional regulator [Clostridiales bacterium]